MPNRTDQQAHQPTPYTPLYGPDHARVTPASVEGELHIAKDFLTEVAATNIHDAAAMIKAAAGLHYRLAALVAAIEADSAVSA